MLRKLLCAIGLHKWGKEEVIDYPDGWKYQKEDYYWNYCQQECVCCQHVKYYQELK